MKKLLLFLTALLTLLLLPMAAGSASAAEVTALRTAARTDGNPPFVRTVLDLSSSVKAVASLNKSRDTLKVSLKNSTPAGNAAGTYRVNRQNVDTVSLKKDGGDALLTVKLKNPVAMDDIKVFALKANGSLPQRLVVDVPSVSTAKAQSSSGVKGSSSSVPAASASDKKVLKGKVICLDPGHGGSDVGAIGTLNGQSVYEKDITLAISLPLRDMLRNAGAQVIMTRSTDKDVARAYAGDAEELQARCDVANKADADIFLSIHIDSFSNANVDGTTAYYYPKSGRDLLLAQTLHQSMMVNMAIPDRGVRSNDLYVNVHTAMPSVLMEMGFISNAHRLNMLTSSWGPKRIAESMYQGIIDYFKQID